MKIERLLGPQGAVVVEHGHPVGGRNLVDPVEVADDGAHPPEGWDQRHEGGEVGPRAGGVEVTLLLPVRARIDLTDRSSVTVAPFLVVSDEGEVGLLLHLKEKSWGTDNLKLGLNLVNDLDGDSQFLAKPELEIYADDVKCTHGATIGQMDADAIFYLRSRGITGCAQ